MALTPPGLLYAFSVSLITEGLLLCRAMLKRCSAEEGGSLVRAQCLEHASLLLMARLTQRLSHRDGEIMRQKQLRKKASAADGAAAAAAAPRKYEDPFAHTGNAPHKTRQELKKGKKKRKVRTDGCSHEGPCTHGPLGTCAGTYTL